MQTLGSRLTKAIQKSAVVVGRDRHEENCARDLVVSEFGFSGANFICGEAAHESAKSKRCIIYFEILYLSLFQFELLGRSH